MHGEDHDPRAVIVLADMDRLDPAGAGQGHVHHHDIGAQGAETGTGGARVLGRSGARQARLQVDQAAVALAQDRGGVGDDDAVRLHAAERPRAIGTRTRMRPPRAPSSSRSLPPIAPVRSAMPIRPWPGAPVDMPAAAVLDGQDDIAPLGMQGEIDPGGHAVAHGIGDAFLHDPEEIERHGAAQAVLVQRAVQPRPRAPPGRRGLAPRPHLPASVMSGLTRDRDATRERCTRPLEARRLTLTSAGQRRATAAAAGRVAVRRAVFRIPTAPPRVETRRGQRSRPGHGAVPGIGHPPRGFGPQRGFLDFANRCAQGSGIGPRHLGGRENGFRPGHRLFPETAAPGIGPENLGTAFPFSRAGRTGLGAGIRL